MRTMRWAGSVLGAMLCAVWVAGCACGNCSGTVVTPTITSVTVGVSPTTITTAQTAQATAIVTGTGNYSSVVTWSVSPASMGSISSAGVFTPATTGTATITATSDEDATKSGSATVTVGAAGPTITSVTVTVAGTDTVGTPVQATATVAGTGAYSSAVSWTLSGLAGGSITTAGVYTPAAAGTETITATSTEDTTKSGSAQVTVTVPAPTITGVTVSVSAATITTAQTSQATATVTGTGVFSNGVTWSVSGSAGGTITSGGLYTPATTGTATITATSTEDATKFGSATVTVNPVPAITSVTVSVAPTSINTTQTAQATATVNGVGAYSSAVTWALSPSTMGTISSTGIFTPSPPNQVFAFGDSLTSGSVGTAGSYPGFLGQDIGYTTYNLGITSQTSSEIAVRMNAYEGQPEQTFTSGFTLPTSSMTAVSVTFPTGFEPAYALGPAPASCTNGVPAAHGNTWGTSYSLQDLGISFVASDGNTYTGCVWQSGTGLYSMYIANPPAGSVTVAAGTQYTAILPNMANGCILIQAGRNNFNNASQVEADLTAMVNLAKLWTECYGVMDILNGTQEPSGTTNYNHILALNNWMQATFGPHHIADRETLVQDYNPADPRDVIDKSHDVPPASLRAQNENGTLQNSITSASDCAIAFGSTIGGGSIVIVGAENIYISGGTDGGYTCTRGYAGTTAGTYSAGQAWVSIDSLHLGENPYTAVNTHCSDGNQCMANAVQIDLPALTQTATVTPVGIGTATITATSVEDPTKTGSAQFTVTETPPTITGITVTPSTATIGTSQQFTALVSGIGSYNASVTWSVSGPSGWTGSIGSISSTGLYMTPYPAPATVTVKATSVGDTSVSGSATVTLQPPATASGPALTVDATDPLHAINPLIYGMNGYGDASTDATKANIPLLRWGGDYTSRYNYQNNISNSASDWYFENSTSSGSQPGGGTFTAFVSAVHTLGAEPLGTVPVLGWVANNNPSACSFPVATYPGQQQVDPYGLKCGNGVYPNGTHGCTNSSGCNIPGGAAEQALTSIAEPPPANSAATMPSAAAATTAWAQATWTGGWVNSLVTNASYGPASGGKGVNIWDLDNEPAWWDAVHRDIHPSPSTYDEVTYGGISTALAIKTIDPSAEVSGPVIDYWWNYFYSKQDIENGWSHGPCWQPWQDPTDREAHGGVAMIEYYLQQFAAAQTTYGMRLLDYVDIHAYDAATYNGASVGFATAGDTGEQEARINSTRVLWDPTYTDPNLPQPNYITDANYTTSCNVPLEAPQLIPMLRKWVANDYPGTKTAIDEYNWGGLESINGALTQADVLGIFGQYGLDLGALWGAPTASQVPGLMAFEIYRNYDGHNSTFGDTALASCSGTAAASCDTTGTNAAAQNQLAVYGALRSSDNALTVVVINKSYGALTSTLSLEGVTATGPAAVYQYSSANLNAIVAEGTQAVTAPTGGGTTSTVTYTFPAQSITLLVIPQ